VPKNEEKTSVKTVKIDDYCMRRGMHIRIEKKGKKSSNRVTGKEISNDMANFLIVSFVRATRFLHLLIKNT
jgi:hypothetical protein